MDGRTYQLAEPDSGLPDEGSSGGNAGVLPGWDRKVRRRGPDCVEDQYYRIGSSVVPIGTRCGTPTSTRPIYQNAPRIVIPPLAGIAMEVAELAAYSFTAVVVNAV